jgi:hypothetical protein
MKGKALFSFIVFLLVVFGHGCQLINIGTEIRTEEPMLNIAYENDRAEELFNTIVHGTEREENVKARIGFPSFSLYSRYETIAFNAHCNDHIRTMDKNADLIISQKEAEQYYQDLVKQGKIKDRE